LYETTSLSVKPSWAVMKLTLDHGLAAVMVEVSPDAHRAAT
jgi:hypothetical protein